MLVCEFCRLSEMTRHMSQKMSPWKLFCADTQCIFWTCCSELYYVSRSQRSIRQAIPGHVASELSLVRGLTHSTYCGDHVWSPVWNIFFFRHVGSRICFAQTLRLNMPFHNLLLGLAFFHDLSCFRADTEHVLDMPFWIFSQSILAQSISWTCILGTFCCFSMHASLISRLGLLQSTFGDYFWNF